MDTTQIREFLNATREVAGLYHWSFEEAARMLVIRVEQEQMRREAAMRQIVAWQWEGLLTSSEAMRLRKAFK